MPERCPNCGTPTRAPEEETPRAAVPLGNIRRSSPARRDRPELADTRTSADSANTGPAPEARRPADEPALAVSRELRATSELAEDDLPAPVASTRPFTLPRLVVSPRIVVSATLDAGRELENSAELDLPHPNDISAVHPLLLAAPPKHEDVDVDLADVKSNPPPLPTEPPEAAPRPAPRLPPPRSRRPQPPATPTPTPAPTLAAYGGLLGLCAAFVALWWLHFSGGEDVPSAGSLIGHVRKFSSPSTLQAGDLEHFEALLNGDRLEDYQAALTLVEERNDMLGRAEAALRIHLRYGPDPVREHEAETWLGAVNEPDDPRALRVRALAALARGDLELAQHLLDSSAGPWSELYRGLVAFESGDFAAAQSLAAAALAQGPEDHAAQWLAFAAAIAGDRKTDLDPLRAAVDRETTSTALQLLLIDTLVGRGLFAEARRRLEGISRPLGASDAHHASVLMQHARVAAAAVETSRSVYWAEEATRQTTHPEIARAALRLMIDADELGRAQQGLAALLRSAPNDPEALVLQVELALRAGNENAASRAIERLGSHAKMQTTALYYRGRLAVLGARNQDAATHFHAAATAEQPNFQAGIEYARLMTRSHANEGLALLEHLLAVLRSDRREQMRSDARAVALARVNLLEETDQRRAAMAALDEALADDPDDNAAQLRRGTLRLTDGQLDAGRSDLLAVYHRTGGYPGLIGPLTRLFIRSGEIEDLEKMLQPLLNDARAPDEVALAVAQLRLAQGAVEAADTMADNVLLRSPSSWEAHLIKSKVHLSRGETAAAQAEIPMARTKQPDAEVELTAGKIHERMGRPQEALNLYRRAFQLDPTLHEARFLYGVMLFQLGKSQDAIVELSAVTKATDAFPAAFVALGRALQERGNPAEALRNFQRASVLKPSLPEASYWLGRSHAERAEHGEAVAALGRATQDAPPDAVWLLDAYLWLGRSAVATSEVEVARTAFERFLSLAPPRAPGRAEAEQQRARLSKGP